MTLSSWNAVYLPYLPLVIILTVVDAGVDILRADFPTGPLHKSGEVVFMQPFTTIPKTVSRIYIM